MLFHYYYLIIFIVITELGLMANIILLFPFLVFFSSADISVLKQLLLFSVAMFALPLSVFFILKNVLLKGKINFQSLVKL